jgi:hypothetical protein
LVIPLATRCLVCLMPAQAGRGSWITTGQGRSGERSVDQPRHVRVQSFRSLSRRATGGGARGLALSVCRLAARRKGARPGPPAAADPARPFQRRPRARQFRRPPAAHGSRGSQRGEEEVRRSQGSTSPSATPAFGGHPPSALSSRRGRRRWSLYRDARVPERGAGRRATVQGLLDHPGFVGGHESCEG